MTVVFCDPCTARFFQFPPTAAHAEQVTVKRVTSVEKEWNQSAETDYPGWKGARHGIKDMQG